MNKINIMLDKGAFAPTRAHPEDAGLDLYSPVYSVIRPGGSTIIDTGVHVQIPAGLNIKSGIVGEGVIDAGYTGSIVVKLYNIGDRPAEIQRCDKITQLVLLPIVTPDVELVDRFPETARGNNGFGSTGR